MPTVIGPELRQRVAHVTVGTLLLEGTDGVGLDAEFRIHKTIKQEPNTCDLSVYNLNPSHRKALESATTPSKSAASPPGTGGVVVPVRIDAGYKNAVSQIWLGELRSCQTNHNGTDNVSTLTTGDGDKAVTRQRVNVSIGPGTTSATAMRALLKALGIGQGNLPTALRLLNQSGLAQIYSRGAILKGLAADHMTDLCRSAGLDWSIQDGQLQVTTLGQPLDGQAILISGNPNTGMIESPTVDTKGVLSFTCLLIPGIRPGVKVEIEGKSAGYKVISCEYEGRTYGENSPWYIRCECVRY